MKKRCVYTVDLTEEQARFLTLLDSYVVNSPLSEVTNELTNEVGEPEHDALRFEVFEGGYDQSQGEFYEVMIRG